MATKAATRTEVRANDVQKELPALPDNELPTIRGLLVNLNIRETVAYVTVRYKDTTSRSGASTLSLKTWDMALAKELTKLPENADIVCEFAPRNTQGADGTWERWNYLSAVWI
ncbi:hypothetical protein VZG28_04970 [Synechococcus elongatus IITB4]|uniref:hypothetical protein n=1 Tax=Synechococcus elongatus TaxID=32046 RepID=UPI0030D27C4A